MLLYLKENLQFTLLLLLWTFTGIYLGSVSFVVITGSILLLMVRGYYVEILIGFWIILMFSDSQSFMFDFAKSFKPIYMVLMGLVVVLHRSTLLKQDNLIFRLFLPFIIWSFLILYDNPRVGLAFQKTLSYGLLFFSVPAVMAYQIKHNQRAALRTIIFFAIGYLFIGLVLRYLNPELTFMVGRFRGLMGNPNGLGVLTFLIALLYDTACRKHPGLFHRQWSLLFWAIILANLVFCQSRSALFATMLYLLFSNISLLRGFLGLLAFIVILMSYQFLMNNLPMIVGALGLEEFFRLDTLEGGSGRLIAWTFAWEQIQDNFFVGRGFTYTDWIFWQNYDLLTNMGHLGNAHNSFLTFWLDTGLIGLVLYVIAFFLMFFSISKIYQNAVPVMYSIIFSASFESWLTASLNPNTITVLMVLSIMIYAKEEIAHIELEEEGQETESVSHA